MKNVYLLRSAARSSGTPCKTAAAAALILILLTHADVAFAAAAPDGSSLGEVMDNTVESSSLIPGILAGFAYLSGLVLGIMGIFKTLEHVNSPREVPIWEPLKRFLTGGALFALPMVLQAAYNTVALDIDPFTQSEFRGEAVGDGLDAMLVNLMADIWTPVLHLFGGFGYLAGIVLVIVGIMRMLKSSQDGVRGPGGIGTIMTFIVGGALMSLDSMMGAFSFSMFHDGDIKTYGVLQYTTGMPDDEVDHVYAVVSAVLAFMMVIGWISFIRGWFILRDVSNGEQQASLMAAFTHLLGGAICVNLGPMLNALQYTLGIEGYGLTFQ